MSNRLEVWSERMIACILYARRWVQFARMIAAGEGARGMAVELGFGTPITAHSAAMKQWLGWI